MTDRAYEAVRTQFQDKELADLTYAIALMNSCNRLAIGAERPLIEQAKDEAKP